jgi:plastocyanin
VTARVYGSILAAGLALAPLAPASAQISAPSWAPSLFDYTGVLLPGRYVPPRVPTTWITPSYVFHYDVPQPVFVPIPEPRRAMEPVTVAAITLRSGVTPERLFVRGGTVVAWGNGDDRARTLVVYPVGQAGTGSDAAPRGWPLPANGRFSMAFHQRGSYEYFVSDEPGRRGHIVVD